MCKTCGCSGKKAAKPKKKSAAKKAKTGKRR